MNVKSVITEAIKSRIIVGLWILIFLLSAGFVVLAVLNTHPSQLQIVSQCSSFDPANCSRDRWFYAINFIVFGVMYFVINFFTSLKILDTKGRPLTLSFLWLVAIIMVIILIIMIALSNVVRISFI